jgi:hypothetical protein
MTDGGCLANARAIHRDSPRLEQALDAAAAAYDRYRQENWNRVPLSPTQLAAKRPLIRAAVEAYLDSICGVQS